MRKRLRSANNQAQIIHTNYHVIRHNSTYKAKLTDNTLAL